MDKSNKLCKEPTGAWTEYHKNIFECYTPGVSMPPVKEEWRLCRIDVEWTVKIRYKDPKGETSIRTDKKPVIKEGCLVYILENETTIIPLQANVQNVKFIKNDKMIDYRLLDINPETKEITVEYRVREEG